MGDHAFKATFIKTISAAGITALGGKRKKADALAKTFLWRNVWYSCAKRQPGLCYGPFTTLTDDQWTVAEFLEYEALECPELECPEDKKWELIGGKIYQSWFGGTLRHHRIIRNIAFAMDSALRPRKGPCEVLTQSMKVQRIEAASCVMPDVIVHCAQADDLSNVFDELTVVAEVLSKSTSSRDRFVLR